VSNRAALCAYRIRRNLGNADFPVGLCHKHLGQQSISIRDPGLIVSQPPWSNFGQQRIYIITG